MFLTKNLSLQQNEIHKSNICEQASHYAHQKDEHRDDTKKMHNICDQAGNLVNIEDKHEGNTE
jgi:hypothetical protein